jgi:aryl-alcohol dehydrogenase-like predicted oxidoreductase
VLPIPHPKVESTSSLSWAITADLQSFGGSLTWEQMDPLLTEMKSLAEKYDLPMSAIALNWVICKGAIPLGGARNAEQAEQVSE